MPAEESQDWHAKHRISEIGLARAVLVANAAKFAAKFVLNPPRPPHWGGYRLQPDTWEF